MEAVKFLLLPLPALQKSSAQEFVSASNLFYENTSDSAKNIRKHSNIIWRLEGKGGWISQTVRMPSYGRDS